MQRHVASWTLAKNMTSVFRTCAAHHQPNNPVELGNTVRHERHGERTESVRKASLHFQTSKFFSAGKLTSSTRFRNMHLTKAHNKIKTSGWAPSVQDQAQILPSPPVARLCLYQRFCRAPSARDQAQNTKRGMVVACSLRQAAYQHSSYS